MARTDEQALLLQVSADIKGLEKAFDRAQAKVKISSKQMEDSASNLEKFFGKPSLAKALDKTFDATRFKILDSGAARIGLFGSSLESLGVAGLGAAAGIGALVGAFSMAREAAKFADDIGDTAAKLHVTTDALQEYRYAIRLAGGEEKGADDALEAFSVTLGKAQEGLGKAKKGFMALGFSEEEIGRFKSAEEALQAITVKIAGLSSNVQKDAVIDQLGLTGLKPLIEGGVESMRDLRNEAHAVGVVMDSSLIQRAGELNDQFETMHEKINVDLKSAFVDLGPILLGLVKLVTSFTGAIGSLVNAAKPDAQKDTAQLKARRDSIYQALNNPSAYNREAQTRDPNIRKSLEAQLKDLDNILGARIQQVIAATSVPHGTKELANMGGGSGSRTRKPKPTKEEVLKDAHVFDQEYADIWALLQYNKKVIEEKNNTFADIITNISDLTTNADMQQQISDAMDATRQSTHDAIYDGVLGGLEAGFQGGVPAMAAYLKDQVLRGLMNAIAEALTSNIMAALSKSGGGGSGFLSTAAAFLGFAGGTNYAPGGVAVVGEHGPEIVNLPRGSQVIPNNLSSTIHQVGQARSQGSTVIQTFHLDATGAVMTEDLVQQINQMGARAAAAGAQQGSAMAVKQVYTRARNRLGR